MTLETLCDRHIHNQHGDVNPLQMRGKRGNAWMEKRRDQQSMSYLRKGGRCSDGGPITIDSGHCYHWLRSREFMAVHLVH